MYWELIEMYQNALMTRDFNFNQAVIAEENGDVEKAKKFLMYAIEDERKASFWLYVAEHDGKAEGWEE